MPPRMWPCENVYSPFFHQKQHGIGQNAATRFGMSPSLSFAAGFVLSAKDRRRDLPVVWRELAALVRQHFFAGVDWYCGMQAMTVCLVMKNILDFLYKYGFVAPCLVYFVGILNYVLSKRRKK